MHRTGSWRASARLGGADAEILAAAASENVDLIVLVTYGRHGLERLIYGSVARALLHHTTVPLLILPADRLHGTSPSEHGAARQTVPPSLPDR